MESAPRSSFRSVQLPVKSRSSNFLLALRPRRPARCWAFFNRAERSLFLSVPVSHSMLCSQAFRFPRQSLERTRERTKSVCPVPLPPMSALLSISASSLPPSLLAGKCIFSPKQNKADLRKCYVRIMGRTPNVWDHPADIQTHGMGPWPYVLRYAYVLAKF